MQSIQNPIPHHFKFFSKLASRSIEDNKLFITWVLRTFYQLLLSCNLHIVQIQYHQIHQGDLPLSQFSLNLVLRTLPLSLFSTKILTQHDIYIYIYIKEYI